MTPDKIIVTLAGIAAIMFVWWFFLGKRSGKSQKHNSGAQHHD